MQGAPGRQRRSLVTPPTPFASPRPELPGGVFVCLSAMTESRPTLYLIDGYALIYRAFFAMIARPLTTRRGENTSAAWGVTNFLIRLLETRRPDYLAWVHDVGESFRHQAYPAYKATREKLTDELQQEFDRSVERIEEILAAFRVPVVGVEGYEADDRHPERREDLLDRKSTRLNSSHVRTSYAVFCLKKKNRLNS